MKKLIALLLVLAMTLTLVACASDTPDPTETDPVAENTEAKTDDNTATDAPTEPEVEEVTLNIAYMPNWGALWAIATAEAKGYFAEEGITLNYTVFDNGPNEIAAMESGSIDISYIGPGAHKLCSTGKAEVVLLQHLGDGDCIIGLNGIKTIEELRGKTIGYAAGTSSENILLTALASVGMTIEDVNAVNMNASAMTTAAIAGKEVDAVAAWSPSSLTILEQAPDATDICSNVDFASLVSPGSWVVNPKWADENEEVLVRFIRAMYKGMDYAASATTDDAVAEEVAGYIAKIIASDAETVLAQRYDGSWKTSAEILEMLGNGEVIRIYGDQQATFIANGAVTAEEALTPETFVFTDLMLKAGE